MTYVRPIALCVLLLAMVGTVACGSPSHVTYIPEGSSYAVDDLVAALTSSDPGVTAQISSEDAPEVRQETLADLRKNGEAAALLADTLTAEFPLDAAAVPYLVELGAFDGEQAWIVYESWGESDEELVHRRLWVLSYDDRTVLATHSIR